jgi:hypothetical protein
MHRLSVTLAAALVGGCAGPSGPPRRLLPETPLAPEPPRRVTFTSTNYVDGEGSRGSSYAPTCTRVVLSERVMRRRGDRELELVVEILDGDHESCSIGSQVTLHAREGGHPPEFGSIPNGPVSSMLAGLYAHLGAPRRTWTLVGEPLPFDHLVGTSNEAGRTYRDYFHGSSESFGPYPSEGHSYTDRRMRTRQGDGRVACAVITTSRDGVNFEYGGWHSHSSASIAIDYGDGASPSCETIKSR